MREILFRGKRIDNGKWVYGHYYNDHLVKLPGKEQHYILRFFPIAGDTCLYPFEVDPETVGQFIGREDKNGVKIFEGDIVKKTDYIPGDDGDIKIVSTGIICWIESWPMFSVGLISGADEAFEHSEGINFYWEELEIIGNIHDNPELLEK